MEKGRLGRRQFGARPTAGTLHVDSSARLGLVTLVCALALVSCGGQPAAIETRPAGTPYEIPISDTYDPLNFNHVVRDSEGGYFCVLRRPDDLAALRATFNQQSG